ncbi:hypothetical protein EPD60_10385 [Flaviaesturariibacter flavus]|uniref:Uncharacterized protein n=1 Tax=Flaviaesturariibacter flavus TaxID=2502780 RepID=A0A4V6NAZ3_9BACT|nr:hypothetical protein [Flaviaesturariibacter flavus]TCJ14392.1 hypothetical protein EPD60_10385 [Flaviaesturariibacter flavus]
MAYIEAYRFRATLPQRDLLRFLAQTPAGQYVFVATADGSLYGLFPGSEIAEYFCNEFSPESFHIIPPEELRDAARQPGCKIWGEASLLQL